MMRQWLKMLVLVLALLSQMAMTCPRDSGSLGSEGPPPARGGYARSDLTKPPLRRGDRGFEDSGCGRSVLPSAGRSMEKRSL